MNQCSLYVHTMLMVHDVLIFFYWHRLVHVIFVLLSACMWLPCRCYFTLLQFLKFLGLHLSIHGLLAFCVICCVIQGLLYKIFSILGRGPLIIFLMLHPLLVLLFSLLELLIIFVHDLNYFKRVDFWTDILISLRTLFGLASKSFLLQLALYHIAKFILGDFDSLVEGYVIVNCFLTGFRKHGWSFHILPELLLLFGSYGIAIFVDVVEAYH